jgi:tRNA threonylcarbamoyladenosine biosynthesis protein TsaB
MKLLAIETSTIACSAALLIDDRLSERFEIAPQRHADLLLPMIGALLADAGLAPAQLDGLAFGRGPGAFTGVRIAAGVAQGIACAADIPVAPVSTLAALAQDAAGDSARVLAVMDARMNEVYWGVYEADAGGIMQLRGEERVCSPDDAPLPDGAGWFGAGDGWGACGDRLRERLGAALAGSDARRWPHARAVALLGREIARRGALLPAEQALPVYLRDNVARTRAAREAARDRQPGKAQEE